MAGKPGNRIVVDAERVGQAERTGEILEVIDRGVSVRYRVRWSDGRETLLRIVSSPAAATGDKTGKQKAKTKKANAGKDVARKKQDKGSGKGKEKRRGGPKAG